MSTSGKAWRQQLKRWNAAVFVAAGLLSLLTAALFGLELFTGMARPVVVTGLIGQIGLIASFVGLCGLYPRLVAHVPRLSRAGVVTVAIAGGATVAFPLCQFAKTSGVNLGPLPIVLFLVAMVGTIGGYLLFAAACMRTGVPSRTVGVLIAAVGATFIMVVAADMAFGGSPVWMDFAVSGFQAGILLTLGYVMPTGTGMADATESQSTTVSG